MNQKELFLTARTVAVGGAIILLLLLGVSEVTNTFFKEPDYRNYITEKNEESPSYQEQHKAYKEAKNQHDPHRFALRMGSGILMLSAGVFLPVVSLGTSLIVAGTLEMCWACLSADTTPGAHRLFCMLLVLILFFFFLYRWDKKNPSESR